MSVREATREAEPTRSTAIAPSTHSRGAGLTTAGAGAAVAIMRQAAGSESGSGEPSVGEAVLEILQGAGRGRPLPRDVRNSMELALGAMFGNVDVHTDSAAHEAADELDADAFTIETDVYFAAGEWAPDTGEGRDVIAHELAHTLNPQPFDPGRVDVDVSDPLAPQTEQVEDVIEPDIELEEEAANEGVPAGLPDSTLDSPDGGQGGGADGDVGGSGAGRSGSSPDPPEMPPAADPGRSDVELIMPPPPAALSDAAQGRLGASQTAAGTAVGQARDLPAAEANTADARGAVEESESETTGRAEAALTAELVERADPSPGIVELCDEIRESIRAKRPVDEDELVDADPEALAQDAGDELNESVEGDADRVEGEYSELEEDQQGDAQLEPVPVEPELEEVPLADPNAGAARPDPVPAQDVALDEDVGVADSDIDAAGMTTEPAMLVQDGPIAAAREARGELGETAEQGPAEVLAEQDATLANASGNMAELQTRALAALASSRSSTVGGVGGQQDQMVDSEQVTRESVSADARRIFTDAQTLVRAQLQPLPETAMEKYTAGVTRLKTVFRQKLDVVKAWIHERHSGIGGAILGGWDSLTGLPGWVTVAYDEAETAFGDGICELIVEISADVNTVIATCEQIIGDASNDIDELFSNLPTDLQEWAVGEQARFQEQLDGLQNEVETTRDDFNREMSRSAVQAVREVQDEIAELREAAKGLIGQIADAIAEFADDPARFIINGLLKLVGISPAAFWQLVAKIGEVISDIAEDPMTFANNLVAGVRQGFDQFFDGFSDHLLKGFFDWLFSGLGAVGVQLPSDFTLKSIITFVLQLLGITWPRIRELLVKHIGEENVELIEKAWEIVSLLIEEGPKGIFEMFAEQMNPQAILDEIVTAAIDYVVETLIKQVTARVIALFNPVGAIVQAVELIYKVLKWVFKNAARIFSFVETVVNGMADVLAGNIQGVADAVELALAKLIPPVIDFLASLIGLGDLPVMVVELIMGWQEWMYGILDRVIGWLADKGRQLLESLGLSGEETPDEDGGVDDELGTSVPFSADGENHRQWIETDGTGATLMVASDQPETVEEKLTRWSNSLDEQFGNENEEQTDEQAEKKVAAGNLISEANSMLVLANRGADELVEAFSLTSDDAPEPPSDDVVEQEQRDLTRVLGQLFVLFGEGTPEQLQQIATHLPDHGKKFLRDFVVKRWEPRIQGVKRASGETAVQVFDGPVLAPAEGLAMAYLDEPATHALLVPAFGRGADSDAFYARAFTTNGGIARPVFLRRFGDAVAVKLKEVGLTNVAGMDNEELHERLPQLAYETSTQPYGWFLKFPDKEKVYPGLRDAIGAAGGIIPFLQGMVSQGQAGGMAWAHLQELWPEGSANLRWMQDRFRGEVPGGSGWHEWIPTNYLNQVVNHAMSLVEADKRAVDVALAWIHTFHAARSPTAFVVFSLDPELRAHEGALSSDVTTYRPTGTAGSAAFHDKLRAIFDSIRGEGPFAFLGVLEARLPTLVSDGNVDGVDPNILDQKLGVFYRPAGEDIDENMTLRELAIRQRFNYVEIEMKIRDVINELTELSG